VRGGARLFGREEGVEVEGGHGEVMIDLEVSADERKCRKERRVT
jgi:hypothetical protein